MNADHDRFPKIMALLLVAAAVLVVLFAVLVGAVAITATVPQWLSGSSEGAGTFLGSLAGALFGLVAILAGALFNAKLNRQRDNLLRNHDQKALAAILYGELVQMRFRVAWRWYSLQGAARTGEKRAPWDWTLPKREIFEANLAKLYLLKPEIAKKVAEVYGLMSDYEQGLKHSDQTPCLSQWAAGLLYHIFDQSGDVANLLAKEGQLRLENGTQSIYQTAQDNALQRKKAVESSEREFPGHGVGTVITGDFSAEC